MQGLQHSPSCVVLTLQIGIKAGIADPDKVLRHMVFISIGLMLDGLYPVRVQVA
jgi:hypothetical protein